MASELGTVEAFVVHLIHLLILKSMVLLATALAMVDDAMVVYVLHNHNVAVAVLHDTHMVDELHVGQVLELVHAHNV